MKLPRIQLPKKAHYVRLDLALDFFELFRRIDNEFENCFLLESLGEESNFARYSVIGFEPDSFLSAKGKELCFESSSGVQSFTVDNPYACLREIVPTSVIARGYAGGLVGYLSYECANYFEPALSLKSHPRFDDFRFGVFSDGLVFDKMTGELIYFYYHQSREARVRSLLDAVPQPARTKKSASRNTKVEFLGDSLSQAQHAARVLEVKELIRAGYIFQCEVGFKSKFRVEGPCLPLYERLRSVNPSPHMYYVKFGPQKIIGASPELLFRLRQGEMETFPLAGGIRRGATAAEDRELARELLRDEKENAEHAMLVDLHRNDIGRVAEFGTVKVRTLMDIKRYSHIQHISSEVVGLLRSGEDMFSALASCFPAGTLSGTPKIEAMKIIDRLEPEARGPYGGGLGHFGFNGDCTFAIPIRSLFIYDTEAYAQTCGGNVYDSVPEREYEEIQRKLAAMKQALNAFT